MREKKFTGGDWKVHNAGNIYGLGDVFEIHYSDGGECVAEIVHDVNDANVIAVSKELLEALEDIIDSGEIPYALSSPYVLAAKLAINKAHGEES
jgi:hypothetical protein